MAEEFARARQFDYRETSNLVLEADHGSRSRTKEPTGEVESLVGKLGESIMGDRVRRNDEIHERLGKMKKRRERKEEEEKRPQKKKKFDSKEAFQISRGATVLTEAQDIDLYRPRTKETKIAYEGILNIIQKNLGDQPQDILRGAADEILAVLKDDRLQDPVRKQQVEDLINSLSDDTFAQLKSYSRRITDYKASAEDTQGQDDKMDEEVGAVAVVFDDEEEEEESDLDEIVEEDEEDEEGLDTESGLNLAASQMRQEDSDEEKSSERDAMNLDVTKIDAFWLQRQLSQFYDDANMSQKIAGDVLNILSQKDERACESDLVDLLTFEKFHFIKLLLRNRAKVVYCTRLGQAQTPTEKQNIFDEMKQDIEGGGAAILDELQRTKTTETWVQDRTRDFARSARREAQKLRQEVSRDDAMGAAAVARRLLDFESMAFNEGSHFMSNRRCELPSQSFRVQNKGYEEIHVPAVKAKPFSQKERLVNISELPLWAQKAFEGMRSLNRIQSRMYQVALHSDENILLCAPTGAGKTNVAMLTILHEVGKHIKDDGSVDLDKFKIIYVAPMKALVQEMVNNFGNRLSKYGIQVRELSGDQSLTKQQIAETQIIVTTPEKWDIITRKSGDRTYTQLVRLIIIDEIHLLHDERGAVLESIVARTIRHIESTQEMIRIIGLSATLPNYQDVSAFLRVKPETGLFYFDNSFRPVPLQQQYIGVTEKKAIKRFQLMNEICYNKVMERAGKNQVLIFVHSRKECAKTARFIRETAMEKDELSKFMAEDAATREILQTEAEQAHSNELKELLPYGFGIHHAGMDRVDRTAVEDLFSGGHIKVLVSTATLAWGVNLPAYTVIIKGTQIYNPEKGRWTELSSLDVMQMLGRAGRPSYDSEGEGIIITSHSELQYYLSLMNQQLPIESQYISKLADNMNAEIVLGTIQNIQEAAIWLGYTYLYVRMLRNPTLYGAQSDVLASDPLLEQFRLDLVYTAASVLAKSNLIKFDKKSGNFQVTALGRVASHYYVSHASISTFNEHLKSTMTDIEIFRLFSLSHEFRYMVVREEEKIELQRLIERVPIPVKESIEEPTAKVNVLLQAYISQLKLEGFALMSDMVYVTQSAGRIMRALFEIMLRRGWSNVALRTLNLCNMINRRMWSTQHPLRQFHSIPAEVIAKLEKKDLPWERYLDLKPQDFGDMLRNPKRGKTVYRCVHQVPRLELAAHVQPITRNTLKIELTVTPDFQYEEKIHGYAEPFWILVEDVDGEHILHFEYFLLKQRWAEEEHVVDFTVPIYDPLPPQYFIRVVSDRWVNCEAVLPVSFRHLILPERYPPHTELLDLQPLPVSALREPKFEALYASQFTHFNPIQTQVFTSLYDNDHNVLIAAPTGSGKTVCAEFAVLRLFLHNPSGKVVYIAPIQPLATERLLDWTVKFGETLGKQVVELTGDSQADLQLLKHADMLISTPEKWDNLSRRWKQRKDVQNVALFIVDEMHLIGGEVGPALEIIVSRMRYIASQTGNKIRIVALSTSLANARDLGEWIGATNHSLFNFHPNVRPVPLEIHIQGFDINHAGSRLLAMSRPVYNAITQHSPDKPVIIYAPSRKQCKISAVDIVTNAAAENMPDRFLRASESDLAPFLEQLQDSTLRHCISFGVGFMHDAMHIDQRVVVERLFRAGALQVLIVPFTMTWGLGLSSHLVIIMDTKYYDGTQHRYCDYAVSDVLQMMGGASRPNIDSSGKCVMLCHTPRKDYYKKFLYEPLPIESHLEHFLHDHFNAEIVTRTIENKQDAVDYLTWTFFYRRIAQNPNYYNLQGVSQRHLSDFLSELVEQTISDLEQSRCIAVEDEIDITPLNLGMVAAYYSIHYTTIELFASSLTAKTKLKGLLLIISSAAEYDQIPIRHGEELALQKLASHLPVQIDRAKYNDPHTKANILLQSHFSRISLASDIEKDKQDFVLANAVRLIQAMVDVISSNGWLGPALAAMEFCQMVVQGLWNRDPILLQIPHFTKEIAERCINNQVETVFELLDLEDDQRNDLLQLSPEQMVDVARFCNGYPNIELNYQIEDMDDIAAGDTVTIHVTLERDADAEEAGFVHAPLYPKQKTQGWWLVMGNTSSNVLSSIKRTTVGTQTKVKMEFLAPEEPGTYKYTLYFMCDSYLGCDQEYEIEISVGEARPESDQDNE